MGVDLVIGVSAFFFFSCAPAHAPLEVQLVRMLAPGSQSAVVNFVVLAHCDECWEMIEYEHGQ
jgi:hypothetical protein